MLAILGLLAVAVFAVAVTSRVYYLAYDYRPAVILGIVLASIVCLFQAPSNPVTWIIVSAFVVGLGVGMARRKAWAIKDYSRFEQRERTGL